MDISRVDLGNVELMAAWCALGRAVAVDDEPNLPPPTAVEMRAELTFPWHSGVVEAYAAHEAGDLVGGLTVRLPQRENTHLAEISVEVRPDARRRGLGSELIARGAARALELGRRLVVVETRLSTPLSALLDGYGFERALVETRSVLTLDGVDRLLLQSLGERASERAGDYSVLRWQDECPPELVEDFCAVMDDMSTAPIGTLQWDDEHWDDARLIETSVGLAARETTRLVVCARHDPSGVLVGLTDVWIPRGRPSRIDQGDTVVVPAHRNRGLGRWIKAEMLQWLLEDHPEVESIQTWNAETNEAMLGVNRELGFRPVDTWAECQLPAEAVLETGRLRSRGAAATSGPAASP